jgi:glutaredoxin
VEALLARFRAAHTQVLGVSVDSIYSHANWAKDLGGISFPLLSDFEPKGAVAKSYGLYLDKLGITDRATVVIDSEGIVRHASSVTPAGQREIEALAKLCEGIEGEASGSVQAFPEPHGVPEDSKLFVKDRCGFSKAALLALQNLHLQAAVSVRNVSADRAAREELVRVAGSEQAPCLVLGSSVIRESAAIIRALAEAATSGIEARAQD